MHMSERGPELLRASSESNSNSPVKTLTALAAEIPDIERSLAGNPEALALFRSKMEEIAVAARQVMHSVVHSQAVAAAPGSRPDALLLGREPNQFPDQWSGSGTEMGRQEVTEIPAAKTTPGFETLRPLETEPVAASLTKLSSFLGESDVRKIKAAYEEKFSVIKATYPENQKGEAQLRALFEVAIEMKPGLSTAPGSTFDLSVFEQMVKEVMGDGYVLNWPEINRQAMSREVYFVEGPIKAGTGRTITAVLYPGVKDAEGKVVMKGVVKVG